MSTIIYCIAGFLFGWYVLHPLLRELPQLRTDQAELNRWRVNAEEARRWLAEFPDVAIALNHVMRCAAGVENPEFIANVRDAMRRRRNGELSGKVAALARDCIAARDETEFRVAYQHLSAECCGDDTPVKPSRWHGLRGL